MRSLDMLACVFSVSVIAACSGGDPGGGSTPADPGDPSLGPVSGGASGGASHDGGATSAHDAAPALPPDPPQPGVYVDNPQDAWSGAPAYKSAPPAIRANDMHSSPVTGQPCLDCHDGTTCTKFDFAGTVWQAPGKTKGAADVEVRLIDANSYAHSVHSDQDGNFWHRATSDLALPSMSGVRTANWKAVGTLNGVSCNHCHNTASSTPGRLFVD